MGCFHSTAKRQHPGYEDPVDLASQTSFSVSEVEALFELFKSISGSVIDDGLINKIGARCHIRLWAVMWDHRYTHLTHARDTQCTQEVPSNYLTVSFKLYDMDSTGFIERKEVKQMLIALLGESEMRLSDDIIETILDKTFSDADANQDGKIDRTEWENFVTRNPSLMKIMTLPYLK
ncbi:calcineurin B-like9 [Zea mays]|nr:calcineurin B-like9 [Zea mays]